MGAFVKVDALRDRTKQDDIGEGRDETERSRHFSHGGAGIGWPVYHGEDRWKKERTGRGKFCNAPERERDTIEFGTVPLM